MPARRSLKGRLLTMLTTLFAGIFLIAATFYFFSSQQDVGRESRAAGQLVAALLASAPRVDGRALLPYPAVARLREARHIDVTLDGQARRLRGHYPGWFRRALALDIPSERIPVLVEAADGGRRAATIEAVPDDEIGEVWDGAVHFVAFSLALLLALNVGAWAIVSRQLRPLDALRAAFTSVGRGEQGVQLGLSRSEELAQVEQGFNRMAVALREANDDRRRLVRELIRVQEAERRSIARELHDEFAQLATGIDLQAAALERVPGVESAMRVGLRSIRDSVGAIVSAVRGRILQLRPEVLDDFGIVAALEDLAERFRGSHPQIDLRVDLPDELRLDDERSITLYRIVQEALTNISRHAAARHARLSVRRADDQIRVRIDDDGVGVPADRPAGGFGVLGMRERAELVAGAFHLGTGPGDRGTRVEVRLPAAGPVGSAA